MKKKVIYTLLIASLGFIPANALIPNTAFAKISDSKLINLKITGSVIDVTTNAKLKNAYIKQVDTLNTVLSDDNGNFQITLDKFGDKQLLISKEGYEPIQITVTPLTSNINVELYPSVRANKDYIPQAHSDTNDIISYVAKPLSSEFTGAYQLRHQVSLYPSIKSEGKGISSAGIAINEIVFGGKIRFDDFMGVVDIFRSRYPVDIDSFPYNPAYYIDVTQFQFGGGKIFKYNEKIDLYAGLTYLLHFNNTDNRDNRENKPVPYTNSFMDFPQTRHALGATGMFGWFFNDFIKLNGGATLYPIVFTMFDGLSKENTTIGYHGMLDLNINIKAETIPGVYVTAGYRNNLFFGFSGFLDESNFVNIGVALDPFKMSSFSTKSNTKDSSPNNKK